MTDSTPRPLPAIVDATPTSLAQPADAIAPLDYLILLWLHEQASPRTRAEYAVTLADFRAHLARVALDLDCGEHEPKRTEVEQRFVFVWRL